MLPSNISNSKAYSNSGLAKMLCIIINSSSQQPSQQPSNTIDDDSKK